MKIDGDWTAVGVISCKVFYNDINGLSISPWLTDITMLKLGDLYVFQACSQIKRGELTYTSGGSHEKSSEGAFIGFGLQAGKYHASIEIKMLDPIKWTPMLWEYRYGPTVALVPVWDVLTKGTPVQMEMVE